MIIKYAVVAQLARASRCQREGRGFESLLPLSRRRGGVATQRSANLVHRFDSGRRLQTMISITGSGEYLDSIRTVDSELLNKLEDPYVLTFPTAAGQESSSRIDYWSDLANEHFSKLGVRHKDFQALDTEALNSPEVLQEVEKANFIYFSGGSPNYLYSQIAHTSFHDLIRTIHKENGILAGCSAGAMIMGEKMIKGTGLG